MAWTGVCEHCAEHFDIEIFHNGFGDSSYAYCDRCGKTAILSGWSKQWPNGVKCTQAEIAPEMEGHLKPCGCGGIFTKVTPHVAQNVNRLSQRTGRQNIWSGKHQEPKRVGDGSEIGTGSIVP